MKIICVTKVEGLTVGKQYEVMKIGPREDGKHQWKMGYFVINDNNVLKRYEKAPMGIINVLEVTDIFLEYVGKEYKGLTYGKAYQMLRNKIDDYNYFLNDDNEFVGIRKVNYLGGKPLFKEVVN